MFKFSINGGRISVGLALFAVCIISLLMLMTCNLVLIRNYQARAQILWLFSWRYRR